MIKNIKSICFFVAIIHIIPVVMNAGQEIKDVIVQELLIGRQIALGSGIVQKYESRPIDKDLQTFIRIVKDGIGDDSSKNLVRTAVLADKNVMFQGNMNVANVLAENRASFIGCGVLNHCYSGTLTTIEGNFVINASVFRGNTIIQDFTAADPSITTSVISYSDCLLDNLVVCKPGIIIELLNTIVTGDIDFINSQGGILIIDNETKLQGDVSNAMPQYDLFSDISYTDFSDIDDDIFDE